MGASTFQCLASGDSLQDAYQNAVQSALYSHGHESYNGTISTTEGVVDRSDRLADLAGARTALLQLKNAGVGIVPGIEYDVLIEAERAWTIEAYNNTEKYGPCWGAKVESGKYIFAGWASS